MLLPQVACLSSAKNVNKNGPHPIWLQWCKHQEESQRLEFSLCPQWVSGWHLFQPRETMANSKGPAVKETGLNGPAAFSSLLPALGFMLRFQEEKEIQPHHISKLNLNKRDPNLYLSGSKPPPIVTPHLSWIGSGIQSPLPTQTFYCVVRCSHHGQCSRPLLLISLEKKMSYSEIVLPYVLLPYLQIPIISSFIEVIGATLFSYPCQ